MLKNPKIRTKSEFLAAQNPALAIHILLDNLLAISTKLTECHRLILKGLQSEVNYTNSV